MKKVMIKLIVGIFFLLSFYVMYQTDTFYSIEEIKQKLKTEHYGR